MADTTLFSENCMRVMKEETQKNCENVCQYYVKLKRELSKLREIKIKIKSTIEIVSILKENLAIENQRDYNQNSQKECHQPSTQLKNWTSVSAKHTKKKGSIAIFISFHFFNIP